MGNRVLAGRAATGLAQPSALWMRSYVAMCARLSIRAMRVSR